MNETITAIRQGMNSVTMDGMTYDVWWNQEPADDDDPEANTTFRQKTIAQLVLRWTGTGKQLSFYGPTREVCLEHLNEYMEQKGYVDEQTATA